MQARHFLLWLTAAVFSLAAPAQPVITAHHYTTDNGLPDNNVRCMAQDDDGFLWLGTLYGLYRFDGHSYRKFQRTQKGNNSLMRTNRIKAISKLENGLLRLRFNTDQFVCYDTRRDLFVEYGDSAAFMAKEKARKKNHFLDNLGNAVVYDNAGSIHYTDRKSGRNFTLRVISDKLMRATTDLKVNVITDRNGLVWVSTNGDGLFLHDPVLGWTRHITATDRDGLIPSDRIVTMMIDRSGDVWMSNVWHGLTRLHLNRSRYNVIRVGEENAWDGEVRVLTMLPDGSLIAGKNRGTLLRVTKDGSFSDFTGMPADVMYNSVGVLPDGTLWGATTKHGLYLKDRFLLGTQRTDRLLADTKGRLWVSSINGLLAVAESFPKDDSSFRRMFTDIPNFEVRCLMQDHAGRIWLGTSIGVISFMPDELLRNASAYEVYPLKENGAERVRVTSLYEDAEHRIWAGTAVEGVFRSSVKDGKVRFESILHNVISNKYIQNITPDGRGNLWISTEGGYAYYNMKTGRAQEFSVSGNRLLNYCNANCAVPVGDGRVAFGTLDGILITGVGDIVPPQPSEKVVITDLLIKGQALYQMEEGSPLYGQNISGVKEVRLSHDQNYITIRFSDMMFDRADTKRYTFWLEGLETEWNEPTTTNSVNYQNLSPGRYVFHIAEIYNGDMTAENSLVIVISEPWWNTWWAYLIYLLLLSAIGYVIYRQIRDRLRLRQAVHDEKMITEYKVKFFTNISHEFRTPLTLIISSIDKLQGNIALPSSVAQTVTLLKGSTERMKRLIDQLLEFRNMEQGKLQLRLQKTDACVFIYNIWQQFHDVGERRKINYTFLHSAKSLPCYMDQGHVDKMLFNIISNAFKYTPAGGEIAVKLDTEGERESRNVVISVADSGVGVPEEKRATLFKRTGRSDLASDSIGIGLNLVAELVSVHHGTITYEPREGGGSVFTITLPMERDAYAEEEFMKEDATLLKQGGDAAEERRGYASRHVTTAVGEPMNDKIVLVAEDDMDILEMLRVELSNYFTVVTACDGVEAIEQLEKKVPDLVILDILMPRKSGMEVLQHIRKSPYRYLPVVMLTAVDSDQSMLRSMKHGADAYITKPFSMTLLVAQCVQLIKQRNYMMLDFGNVENNDGEANAKIAKLQSHNKIILPEIITEERDRRLVAQMDSYIEAHIADADLNVDKIAEALGYRRTNFYKKITALLGCSPKEYVRKRRIMRAAEMLQDEKYTVAEIAYKLGFSSPQYLSSVFKAHFGVNPSEYQKGK